MSSPTATATATATATVSLPSSFVMPEQFPVTLLCCAVLCFQCFFIGMFVVGGARKKAFTPEFMEQFKEEHEKAFPGSSPAAGGHPDAGDGRYSDKLSYQQWNEFNVAMRTHMNFVEWMPTTLGTLILGGLYLPRVTMWVAIVNTVARGSYTYMYMTKGSENRKLATLAG